MYPAIYPNRRSFFFTLSKVFLFGFTIQYSCQTKVLRSRFQSLRRKQGKQKLPADFWRALVHFQAVKWPFARGSWAAYILYPLNFWHLFLTFLSFQVTLQGVFGNGIHGDIAVDDISLSSEEECNTIYGEGKLSCSFYFFNHQPAWSIKNETRKFVKKFTALQKSSEVTWGLTANGTPCVLEGVMLWSLVDRIKTQKLRFTLILVRSTCDRNNGCTGDNDFSWLFL